MKLNLDYSLPEGLDEFMITKLVCSILNAIFVFLSLIVNGALFIVRTIFLFAVAAITLCLDLIVGFILRITGLLK